jgi:beta-aspartyl-dipeptidase (metallo-type)
MLTLLRNVEIYAPSLATPPHPGGRRQVLWMGRDLPLAPGSLGVSSGTSGAARHPGARGRHVHLTGGGGESGPESRVPPVPLTRFTRGGVTTVVGVLGTDDVTRTTGSLVAAARGLVAEGLSAWCHTGGYHLPPTTLTGSVRGDIVHVDRIIGVGEVALSDHRSSQPTLDELLRLAGEAHVAGLMTGKAGIVHLHLGGRTARACSSSPPPSTPKSLPRLQPHPVNPPRLFERRCNRRPGPTT